MTRKDFEQLAAGLRRARLAFNTEPTVWVAIGHTVECVADVLEADNPRFDRARFEKACRP